MNPLSGDLGDALLRRHKDVCSSMPAKIEEVTRENISAATISYKSLLIGIGAPESLAPTIGKYLFEVAAWCSERKLPPVNALAVNGSIQMPGAGYFLAPGGEDWEVEIRQCIACKDYPSRMITK